MQSANLRAALYLSLPSAFKKNSRCTLLRHHRWTTVCKVALPRLSEGWGVGVAGWSLSWMWRGVRSFQVGRTGLEGGAWARSEESRGRGLGGGWGVLGGNGAGALRHPGLSLGGLPAHATQTAARELEPHLLIPWGLPGPTQPRRAVQPGVKMKIDHHRKAARLPELAGSRRNTELHYYFKCYSAALLNSPSQEKSWGDKKLTFSEAAVRTARAVRTQQRQLGTRAPRPGPTPMGTHARTDLGARALQSTRARPGTPALGRAGRLLPPALRLPHHLPLLFLP